eukprot:TRINITY_DN292_c0_g2_i1.p1 TRINITY_DN292_c0_g2~~TRINITY_DN292_c0_g2_i1.p1  ORF type:complete len:546 (-),score=66.82 TRINITY_DN292_c0_g2_i1:805-2442(-)
MREVLFLQMVVVVLGQEWVWKQGRATFYGEHSTIHRGSCGFGQICPNNKTGWDVAALAESHWDYDNSCGRCYEVQCRSAKFTDGFGSKVDRSGEDICIQNDASVVVTVVDTCPCNSDNNYYSNARWCCGDMEHLGLSVYAFEKLADKQNGVIGISYREVPCDHQPYKIAQQIEVPSEASYDFDENKCSSKQSHESEETLVQSNSKTLEQNELVNAQQNQQQKWSSLLYSNFNPSLNSQNNLNKPQNVQNTQNQEQKNVQNIAQQGISFSQKQVAQNANNARRYGNQNILQQYLLYGDQPSQIYDKQNLQNIQYEQNVEEFTYINDLNQMDMQKLDYYTKLTNQIDTNMLKNQRIVISNLDASITQNQSVYDNLNQENNWWVLSSKAYLKRRNGESRNPEGTSICGEIQPGGFVEFVGTNGAFFAQSTLQIWIKEFQNSKSDQNKNGNQDDKIVPDLDLNIGSSLGMCAPFRLVDLGTGKTEENGGYAKLNINLGIFDVPRTNTQNYVFKECNGILASSINALKFTNSKMVSQTVCIDQINLVSFN